MCVYNTNKQCSASWRSWPLCWPSSRWCTCSTCRPERRCSASIASSPSSSTSRWPWCCSCSAFDHARRAHRRTLIVGNRYRRIHWYDWLPDVYLYEYNSYLAILYSYIGYWRSLLQWHHGARWHSGHRNGATQEPACGRILRASCARVQRSDAGQH